MTSHIQPFGTTKSGEKVSLYTIRSGGISATVTDFGAALVSLIVPDRNARPTDIILGYDRLSQYEADICFFGGSIGRVGNRIGGASFALNGKTYQMDANENGNCLHGGFSGYHVRLWKASDLTDSSVRFLLHSPDGDQGLPGALDLQVTYTVTQEDDGACCLQIDYEGQSDQDTLLNPTNHAYFNLNGHDSGSILGHTLQIHADAFTAVQDSACIPRENKSVEGTPFDFREGKPIGRDIDDPQCLQLTYGNGYDHNFVIAAGKSTDHLRTAASVTGDFSGITMGVCSDLPSIQFYAGNGIPEQTGKGGAAYGRRCAFCLETQYTPDSIHHPDFAQPCSLKAGTEFRSTTIYRFGVL